MAKRNALKIALAMISIVGEHSHALADSSSPGHEPSGVCNYAKVHGLKDASYLTVRSGPDKHFRKLDQLGDGAEVYICDENREWYKIFYSDSDGPCGTPSPNGLDSRKAAACKSGWAHRNWIDVISG